LAEVTLQDGETVESALRRFKEEGFAGEHHRGSQKALLLLEAWPETPRQAGIGP
jgi:hypothetical protein